MSQVSAAGINNSFVEKIDATTIHIERVLPGPIERVWDYLVVGEKRATWLAGGYMEPHVGARFELIFNNEELTGSNESPPEKYAQYTGEQRMDAEVTAFEPPRLLAFNWYDFEDTGNTHVRIELSDHEDGVLLKLTHSKIENLEHLIGGAAGWDVHIAILIDRLEGKDPKGFWGPFNEMEAVYGRRFS